MKNIWTQNDIEAGLYIIKNYDKSEYKDLNFKRTITFKIGFSEGTLYKYGFISCLTDGCFIPIGSKLELAKHLTNDKDGYRPLSKDEYIEMLNSSNQGFY